MDDKIVGLLDKLVEKTDKKAAIWNRTSRKSKFKLDFNQGSFTIDFWVDDEFSQHPTVYEICLFNGDGDIILQERFSDAGEETDLINFHKLKRLYEIISKRYYKVDETIDGLFNEIEAADIIGKKSEEQKEDLPF